MEDYFRYILIALWLIIGAVSYIIDEKKDPAKTRGEFIVSLFACSIFGLLAAALFLTYSDWWNKPIN